MFEVGKVYHSLGSYRVRVVAAVPESETMHGSYFVVVALTPNGKGLLPYLIDAQGRADLIGSRKGPRYGDDHRDVSRHPFWEHLYECR